MDDNCYQSTLTQSLLSTTTPDTDLLIAKAQSLEDQLKLLQEQVDHVAHDLEQFNLTSPSAQLKDICSRLRVISMAGARPHSMVITHRNDNSDPPKRCNSESKVTVTPIKSRKKSMTMERLESQSNDRHLRARNSLIHMGSKSTRDAGLNYQLSSDLQMMQECTIAKKYGDPKDVVIAAVKIQRVYRQYRLRMMFDRIKLETPLRTKSMNKSQRPAVRISRTSESDVRDFNVTHRIIAPQTPGFDLEVDGGFKRNGATRQMVTRTKVGPLFVSPDGGSCSVQKLEFEDSGSLYDTQTSEPKDFKVPKVPSLPVQRRNTDLTKSSECPLDQAEQRPYSNSWSSFPQISVEECAPLGERMSGDGAECPGTPVTEFSSQTDDVSPIAQKYSSLWETSKVDSDQRDLSRQYKLGVHKFNKHPVRGVKHLTSMGVVGSSPKEIAAFLLNGKGLSLSKIGEYITDLRKTLCMEVLEEFMKQMDFTSLPFEQGLRHFISKLRLPGEAQKIDKLMEAFAERYCECNPGIISTEQDTIYVLAFSVIILQTDLHNPQIKLEKKMGLEAFINNNRGIDNGEDLCPELLTKIYEGVKREPIISGKDHLDFLESIDKGIVGKKPSLMDPWRMLMGTSRMSEVVDRAERPIPDKHIRQVFLFNDIIVITKGAVARSRPTKAKEKFNTSSTFQYRQHHMISTFKAESFTSAYYPYGIKLVDQYDETRVLIELAADKEEDRKLFLAELAEVTWVHRALENDRIGTLGVSDKMAQSTLSLHSFNSDSDNGRSRHGTLGRKFFKNNFFKPNKRDHLSPSSSLFYTKGISSSDVRQDEAPVVENIDDIDDIEEN